MGSWFNVLVLLLPLLFLLVPNTLQWVAERRTYNDGNEGAKHTFNDMPFAENEQGENIKADHEQVSDDCQSQGNRETVSGDREQESHAKNPTPYAEQHFDFGGVVRHARLCSTNRVHRYVSQGETRNAESRWVDSLVSRCGPAFGAA